MHYFKQHKRELVEEEFKRIQQNLVFRLLLLFLHFLHLQQQRLRTKQRVEEEQVEEGALVEERVVEAEDEGNLELHREEIEGRLY